MRQPQNRPLGHIDDMRKFYNEEDKRDFRQVMRKSAQQTSIISIISLIIALAALIVSIIK